jgi:hypothetical protein
MKKITLLSIAAAVMMTGTNAMAYNGYNPAPEHSIGIKHTTLDSPSSEKMDELSYIYKDMNEEGISLLLEGRLKEVKDKQKIDEKEVLAGIEFQPNKVGIIVGAKYGKQKVSDFKINGVTLSQEGTTGFKEYTLGYSLGDTELRVNRLVYNDLEGSATVNGTIEKGKIPGYEVDEINIIHKIDTYHSIGASLSSEYKSIEYRFTF